MVASLEPALAEFAERARVAVTIADVTRDDFPLILVNPHFCELSGYQAEEVLGRNCRFLQGDERAQAGRADIVKFLADENTPAIRTSLLNFRKNGEPFVNLVLMTRLSDQGGRTRYIFASQFDVTKTSGQEMDAHDAILKRDVARMNAIAADHRYIMNASLETIGRSVAQIAQCRMALG
ncbi:PAS domain-containing protein [Aurantimonas coralicida]|uniref:PAS domain-containing protein n=1 Tax=Aurantimonas coralicida TaxID=182270 RepID=UPI001D1897DF|nr:PAS domain-containing protein [Aurantimonas coralicida]MCC4298182.1 PAS domain-containing protein [Aurantimonas coralicida]